MIRYLVDSEGVWVRDSVGGVGVLVSARVALNADTYQKLIRHLKETGQKEGAGVFGVCVIKH